MEGDLLKASRLLQQSLDIQLELADQQGRVRSLTALARVARDQGDSALARNRYLESLQAARVSYQVLEIARSLEGVAELDAPLTPERALRLIGAAGALRKAIGAELYADELHRQNAWLQRVYQARGERACAAGQPGPPRARREPAALRRRCCTR